MSDNSKHIAAFKFMECANRFERNKYSGSLEQSDIASKLQIDREHEALTAAISALREQGNMDKVRDYCENEASCGALRSMPNTIRADVFKEIVNYIDTLNSEEGYATGGKVTSIVQSKSENQNCYYCHHKDHGDVDYYRIMAHGGSHTACAYCANNVARRDYLFNIRAGDMESGEVVD